MDIFGSKEAKALDAEIDRLILTLSGMDKTNENYMTVVDNLKILCETREKKNPNKLNIEMMINVGANILGLLMILNFEKTGVITSRAMAFLWKGKQ